MDEVAMILLKARNKLRSKKAARGRLIRGSVKTRNTGAHKRSTRRVKKPANVGGNSIPSTAPNPAQGST